MGQNLFRHEFSTDFRPIRAGETATRAYIHHLLHSHEMTAHVLLSLHNHRVMQEFVASVREVMAGLGKEGFESEVRRFCQTYTEQDLRAWKEAELALRAVDKERGKGRMKESRLDEAKKVSREKTTGDERDPTFLT
jgi:Queuine tRNA-ribosyltransferase